MMLAYEPEMDADALALAHRTGVRLLGIEATDRRGAWRTMRHVFELDDSEAALYVEVGPFGGAEPYAVAYDIAGEELLTPL